MSTNHKDPPRVVWLAFDHAEDKLPFAFATEAEARDDAESSASDGAYVAGPYVLAEPSFVDGGT